MGFPSHLGKDADAIHHQAVESLFALFEDLCEGALAVDPDARIVWINDKYRVLLRIPPDQPVLGRPVEEVIPHSMMRRVVETGKPILLDIMEFGDRSFVVTRLPLRDEHGTLIGGVGFVLYDRLDCLAPLVSKFERMRADLADARRRLDEARRAKYTISQFVGSSPACLEVKRIARRAAQLDTTVMLLGETGTGKELLAHAIHASSRRTDRPFVGVNVAAIPETLLEAEFFGVAPGAYTGADRKGRDGKFKLADGGTLFLDEIGEMPTHVQAKLLRALQEQEIEQLGSNRIMRVDVRIIAATSGDLKLLVDEGRFRADLYFRLNVLPITVPPLRERLSDVGLLCETILEDIASRTGFPRREITAQGLEVLKEYHWPGNVRELRNVLERACMLSDRSQLEADDFKAIVPARARRLAGARVAAGDAVRPLADAVAEVERNAICAALQASGGTKARAARMLGISRSRLYEKLVALNVVSGKEDTASEK